LHSPCRRQRRDGGGVATGTVEPDQHSLELYPRGYLSFGTRPVISTAPPSATYGSVFCGRDLAGCQYQFDRVDRADLGDPPHRCLTAIHKTPIRSRKAATIETEAPASGNIAPPGFYMLFMVNNQWFPPEVKFVAIS